MKRSFGFLKHLVRLSLSESPNASLFAPSVLTQGSRQELLPRPASCACRYFAKQFTPREDDLIQDALDDRFGAQNIYQENRRRTNVKDARLEARIDQAWDRVVGRIPHIAETLAEEHGFCKTGTDVYERGRRAVIYYECFPGSEQYVARYLETGGKWLGHRLGDAMRLKYRPKFEFVRDGLSEEASELLEKLAQATAEVIDEKSSNKG